MDLSRVQAVLLDMDGTLVDSDAAVERAWRTWAVEYRVDLADGPLIAHGMPAVGNVRRLRPDLAPDEALAAAGRQLELQYDDVADVTAAPGAHELLGELDRIGLPWAVVTSADPRRCLVVEDAEAGVRAGRAAGATVAALKGVPADIAIAGLPELTSLLRAARVRSRT
jgi:sugar-phosphatase